MKYKEDLKIRLLCRVQTQFIVDLDKNFIVFKQKTGFYGKKLDKS